MKSHGSGKRLRVFSLLGLFVVLGALGLACTQGVSQKGLDAANAPAQAKEREAAQPKTQVSQKESELTTRIVQTGQLQPAPAGAPAAGWATPESIRGGLKLVATFDSSGPDAWSAKDHALVYITSEGTLAASPLYDKKAPYFAGFHIVDAYTKKVVASALFNVGQEITAFPHGVDVSPDGKWAYVGWGQKDAAGQPEGVAAIINMRTLKIDKLLKQESLYQGEMRSQRLHHVQAFRDSKGQDRVILQWGFGADGGPHFILDPKNDNKVVKAITYDDVKPMGHPFTTPSPDGKYIYVSMGSPEIREGEGFRAGIAKVNLEDGSVTVIHSVGSHPIGITHTADGRFTYVVDGSNSLVFKVDNGTNQIVGRTSAGVAGPYGIA
ncbi:MAG: hypothetical protein HY671_03455, partial [Chloroflexi bacterium]|nr:hypothetical protein [Chloroflexota bacterium]